MARTRVLRTRDLFDRMVMDELKKRDHGPDDPCLWLIGPEVVALLRRYHARVRRLVMERSVEYMKEANKKIWNTQTQASYASKAWAFKDFAEELDRLKKGTR